MLLSNNFPFDKVGLGSSTAGTMHSARGLFCAFLHLTYSFLPLLRWPIVLLVFWNLPARRAHTHYTQRTIIPASSAIMEIGNNRQLPVLAHRPSFPQGLHVLLLEPDVQARTEAESQLRECEYDVTSCSSTAEASTRISNPTSSFDVLLFDVQSMQSKTPDSSVLSAAAKLLPLVLMSASSDSALVYLGVKLGAVDVLEKPLSPLKLKNIWQHTVRRLMSSCGTSAEAQRKHPANVLKRNVHRATLQHLVSEQQAAVEALQLAQQAPVPHLPATQPEPAQGVPVSMPKDVEPVQHLQPFAELQQQDAVQHLAQQQQQMMQLIALSPAHSSGASHGGESGSNASTSDRDHAKLGLDFELEASSFQDAMLLGSSDALTNLLAPLGAVSATAGAHDSMLNLASLLEANTSHAGESDASAGVLA